jgi:Zn-dependent M16 (insulinase) family peptidase
MILVNWLIGETTDPEVSLGYDILDHVLTGTLASPLRKALIDSGLGEELLGGGLNDGLRQAYFSIGLKGVATDDVDKVEDVILRTLADLAQNGIDRDTVEASLNTAEFRLRENNTGHFPRGLSLMLRSLGSWLYGADPVAPLAFEAPLAAIKERIATDDRYLESMIDRLFLKNGHRTTVILHPDPDLASREEEAEKARLAQARAAMSPRQIQELVGLNERLKLRQETPDSPEALATIPRLALEDLDRQEKTIPREVLERAGTNVLYHDLFTNGIVYLDVGFDLHVLPRELLPYVPLFARALLEVGTTREDVVKLTQRIGRSTGGIHPDVHLSTLHDGRQATAWLFLRGKAMLSQADELLAILRDIITSARLDNRERFRQMVLEQKARQEASLVPGGSGVVGARLGAHFGEAAWVGEQLHGISNLFFVRQLARAVDDDWPRVQAALEQIRQMLVNRGGMICNVTLDAAGWQSFAPRLDAFLADLPSVPAQAAVWSPEPLPSFEGLVMPGKVNYVGKAASLYDAGYRYDGSAEVIGRFLSRTWLWDQVRVKGGAYGISGRLNHRTGVFAYVSYRDPNLLDTLSVYDQSARFLREVALDQGEVTKAIIGAISDIDPYMLPDAKGRVSLDRYLSGEPDAFRQRVRDEVLSTTVEDFRAFADALDAVKDLGHVVVLGSPAAVEGANRERPGFLTVTDLGL